MSILNFLCDFMVGGVSAQHGHVRHGPAHPQQPGLAYAYQPLRRVYSPSSPSLTGRFIASSRVCSTKCNTAILSKACLLWVAGCRQVAAAGLAPRASLIGGETSVPLGHYYPEVAIIARMCRTLQAQECAPQNTTQPF